MSASVRDTLVEILARLRLCCEALDVDPADVDLADVLDSEAQRLRAQATLDLAALIDLRERSARAAIPHLSEDAERERASRRTARFRAIAAERRAKRLKQGARVPHRTKRDQPTGSNETEAQPCTPESQQHKIA